MRARAVIAAMIATVGALCAVALVQYARPRGPELYPWGTWDDCVPFGSADYRCTFKEI